MVLICLVREAESHDSVWLNRGGEMADSCLVTERHPSTIVRHDSDRHTLFTAGSSTPIVLRPDSSVARTIRSCPFVSERDMAARSGRTARANRLEPSASKNPSCADRSGITLRVTTLFWSPSSIANAVSFDSSTAWIIRGLPSFPQKSILTTPSARDVSELRKVWVSSNRLKYGSPSLNTPVTSRALPALSRNLNLEFPSAKTESDRRHVPFGSYIFCPTSPE